MIEIGRRGFITGLVALVAAPAIVRVAPLMKISTRHTPLYVPANWLTEESLLRDMAAIRETFEAHAWPRPLADNWIDVRDFDPAFVRQWTERKDEWNLMVG
jgi:hypothetical protein